MDRTKIYKEYDIDSTRIIMYFKDKKKEPIIYKLVKDPDYPKYAAEYDCDRRSYFFTNGIDHREIAQFLDRKLLEHITSIKTVQVDTKDEKDQFWGLVLLPRIEPVIEKETDLNKILGKDKDVITILRVCVYIKGADEFDDDPKCYEIDRDLGWMQVSYDFDHVMRAYFSDDLENNEMGMLAAMLMAEPRIAKDFEQIHSIMLEAWEIYKKDYEPVPFGRCKVKKIYDYLNGWQ